MAEEDISQEKRDKAFQKTLDKIADTVKATSVGVSKHAIAVQIVDKKGAVGEDRTEEKRERVKREQDTNSYLKAIAESSTKEISGNNNKGGGGIGGILGGLGAGAGIAGAGLGALAGGMSAITLASVPFTGALLVISAGLLAFGVAVGAMAWLIGKGSSTLSKGLTDIGKSLLFLSETGKKLDMESLKLAGVGLKTFLENVGNTTKEGWFGAAITFLTGDLEKIAKGINLLNNITVDKKKMEDAGLGLNAFMSAMGEGSFFGKLMGTISTAIAPDMEKLAHGFGKLSDLSKTFDLQKFLDMSKGMAAISDPIKQFSKSGIVANFVGSKALSDISDGVTALNKTEVNRLIEVSTAMGNLDKNMFEVVKTGFVANFVGKGALEDISDGVTYVNKTEVDRLGTVATGLTSILDPLKSITLIGFGANFVGKGAITDISDGVSTLVNALGTKDMVSKTILASKALDTMKASLGNFTTGTLFNSLKGVGTSILAFISGTKSPVGQMQIVAENAAALQSGAEAIGSISENLDKIGNLKFKGGDLGIAKFAEDLLKSIPDIEVAIKGGKVSTGIFSGTVIEGLGSTNIPWNQAGINLSLINKALNMKTNNTTPSIKSTDKLKLADSGMEGTDRAERFALQDSIVKLTAAIANMGSGSGGANIINAPMNIKSGGGNIFTPPAGNRQIQTVG